MIMSLVMFGGCCVTPAIRAWDGSGIVSITLGEPSFISHKLEVVLNGSNPTSATILQSSENTLSFDNPSTKGSPMTITASASLDKPTYNTGDTMTLTVTYSDTATTTDTATATERPELGRKPHILR